MADLAMDESTKSPEKKKLKTSKPHVKWDQDEEDLLLNWLERPGNYNRYCGVSDSDSMDVPKSKTTTKRAICEMIEAYFRQKGKARSWSVIKDKISSLQNSWKIANDYLGGTGNGVDGEGGLDRDGKLKVETIKDKVRGKCANFARLDVLMFTKINNNPPFVTDNMDKTEDYRKVLLTAAGATNAAVPVVKIAEEEPQQTTKEAETALLAKTAVVITVVDREEQETGKSQAENEQLIDPAKPFTSKGDTNDDWEDEKLPNKTADKKTTQGSASKPKTWKKSPNKPERSVEGKGKNNAVKLLMSLEEGKDRRFEETMKLAERKLELRYEDKKERNALQREALAIKRLLAESQRLPRQFQSMEIQEEPEVYDPAILD